MEILDEPKKFWLVNLEVMDINHKPSPKVEW
jgi:hypothetical protein